MEKLYQLQTRPIQYFFYFRKNWKTSQLLQSNAKVNVLWLFLWFKIKFYGKCKDHFTHLSGGGEHSCDFHFSLAKKQILSKHHSCEIHCFLTAAKTASNCSYITPPQKNYWYSFKEQSKRGGVSTLSSTSSHTSQVILPTLKTHGPYPNQWEKSRYEENNPAS